MATIVHTAQGTWRVQVRRKGMYASKTFRLKGQAQAWAREIEHIIDEGGEPSSPSVNQVRNISHVIDLHISDLLEVGKPIRRSKRAVLEALKRDLGRAQLRNLI